jgi:hypothetical protein
MNVAGDDDLSHRRARRIFDRIAAELTIENGMTTPQWLEVICKLPHHLLGSTPALRGRAASIDGGGYCVCKNESFKKLTTAAVSFTVLWLMAGIPLA